MTDRLKLALRRTCCQVRQKLSIAYQQDCSAKICATILKLEAYQRAQNIALYYAMRGEISLNIVWEAACREGKRCYFPVLNADKTLSFLPATLNTSFIKNRYGIPEPNDVELKAVDFSLLDILFIPLVAFDKQGTRLGMGAGYYDRTLSQQRKASFIGVGYEFQRQSYIEPCFWDVPLSAIITQDTVYWSK